MEWVWWFSKLTPNSRFCVFFFSVFLFNFWKTDWVWSEFGDSPNSLQTHSKLCLNSICYFFGGFFLPFFEKNDFGQTHSKLGANWFCSLVSFLFQSSLEKMNLECQTLSKLGPNSNHCLCVFFLFVACSNSCFENMFEFGESLGFFQYFVWGRAMNLKWFWKLFNLSLTCLQTHSKPISNSNGFFFCICLTSFKK